MPGNIRQTERLQPIYEEIEGWREDLSQVRNLEDLPTKTRAYLKRIEEITETPAFIVSVGPGREQTILLKNPFE
jgi:adenylosuccinate synthase